MFCFLVKFYVVQNCFFLEAINFKKNARYCASRKRIKNRKYWKKILLYRILVISKEWRLWILIKLVLMHFSCVVNYVLKFCLCAFLYMYCSVTVKCYLQTIRIILFWEYSGIRWDMERPYRNHSRKSMLWDACCESNIYRICTAPDIHK